MEDKDYRNVLADLRSFFDNRGIVTASDVAAYSGLCRQTAAKRFEIPRNGIALPILARKICEEKVSRK